MIGKIKLTPNRRQQTEYTNTSWTVTAEEKTPYSRVLEPDYWSNAFSGMRPYDTIRVIAEDGAYFAELLVVDCGHGWVKVKELTKIELSEVKNDKINTGDYEVAWKGPHHKWCVIRSSDNHLLKKELKSKEAGLSWITEYNKAMAA